MAIRRRSESSEPASWERDRAGQRAGRLPHDGAEVDAALFDKGLGADSRNS